MKLHWIYPFLVQIGFIPLSTCQKFSMNNYVDEQNNSNQIGCTFPDDIQGTYVTQDFAVMTKTYDFGLRDPLKYKDIFVGPTSIPYWGDCFEKSGKSKVGGYMCYRCFVLIERTVNVLQAQTVNENACYRTIEEARQTCLDASMIHPGEGTILWRTENVQYQYCPIGGRANLTYSLGNRLHCPYPAVQPSTISNCQLGYQLDIVFKSCTFPAYEMSLRCLGTWDAGKGNGETYFAVYNTVAEEYRCGIYKDDRDHDGYAMAALSNDSTCTNMLQNNTYGYEKFTFFSEAQSIEWPGYEPQCSFPDWLQTDWEIMTVGKELISYYQNNDPSTMMTLYGKCVSVEGDYIKVFSKTHCGDTLGYHCLWFNRHSTTMAELKIGFDKSKNLMSCNKDDTYANSNWTALTVRNANNGFVPCSHLGFYGTVKKFDRQGQHCYNLTVDCQESNRLLYTSYLCGTENIYESHQYRCLSSWTEGDYYFTYTLREDTSDRGCLVSKYSKDKEQLYLTWTDRNCNRNVQFEGLLRNYNDIDAPVLVLENKYDCNSNKYETNKVHHSDSGGNSNSRSSLLVLFLSFIFYPFLANL